MTLTALNIPAEGEFFSPGVSHVQSVTFDATDCSSAAVTTIVNVLATSDNPVYVKELRTRVNTAFTAGTTLTIGDTDVDGWLTAVLIACTTAVTTGLMKSSMTADSLNANGIAKGKIYSDTDAITISADGLTAGQLEVLIEYCAI
ncbi:MAG: hypothetical protein KJ556_20580 [Gammaproteobacteria bacterium]|nr:hypothetical protein [Gammaproteobacteria bacterium]